MNDGEINKLDNGKNSNKNFVEHKISFILKKQTDVIMSLAPPVTSSENLPDSQECSDKSHKPIGEMVLVSSGRSTAGNEIPKTPKPQTDVQQPFVETGK